MVTGVIFFLSWIKNQVPCTVALDYVNLQYRADMYAFDV